MAGEKGFKHLKILMNFGAELFRLLWSVPIYSVIHQYLFMADTIFEHLKYQLDQN
jgi:hypothetical protein